MAKLLLVDKHRNFSIQLEGNKNKISNLDPLDGMVKWRQTLAVLNIDIAILRSIWELIV